MTAKKPKPDKPVSPEGRGEKRIQRSGGRDQIVNLWKKLSTVTTLRFSVQGHSSRAAMDYEGAGSVRITWLENATMEYDEEGSWQHPSGKMIHFRNIYRWVRDDMAGCLKLYHRRNDAVEPVFLCEFVPSGAGQSVPATPHVCGRDTYLGELRVTGETIELRWSINGPAKNDLLSVVYHVGTSPETSPPEPQVCR